MERQVRRGDKLLSRLVFRLRGLRGSANEVIPYLTKKGSRVNMNMEDIQIVIWPVCVVLSSRWRAWPIEVVPSRTRRALTGRKASPTS